ncbi:hypothetical protein [Nonomuraea dietziae]|uniref:Uncharacterized protein n=1 Tax=Nonomuraea dietziae TaxID=65515 RepID=A0A7W5VP06_9ACTN|nr:hypothetical protein [Nonomuraea dietziae]MBB3731612.1 hypothetical protein [Nonomuraea dietziae]
MAFLSRLFKRGSGDPLAERDRERDDAHRQGLKDARELPLPHFTDPDCEPAFLSEVRARARERIARVDQGLAARRTDLLRQVGEARETVFRETGRADLYPEARPDAREVRGSPGTSPNGRAASAAPATEEGASPAPPGTAGAEEDPFISIAEARWRRAERARESALREASDRIHRARSRIEQLAREWDGVLVERNHEVEAVHAWAQQVIAAYRRGVMGAHPRREEIPSLWKGEVVAMDSSAEGVTSLSSREEIGGLLEEVEHRIEIWHSQVREVLELSRGWSRQELLPGVPEGDRRNAPESAPGLTATRREAGAHETGEGSGSPGADAGRNPAHTDEAAGLPGTAQDGVPREAGIFPGAGRTADPSNADTDGGQPGEPSNADTSRRQPGEPSNADTSGRQPGAGETAGER